MMTTLIVALCVVALVSGAAVGLAVVIAHKADHNAKHWQALYRIENAERVKAQDVVRRLAAENESYRNARKVPPVAPVQQRSEITRPVDGQPDKPAQERPQAPTEAPNATERSGQPLSNKQRRRLEEQRRQELRAGEGKPNGDGRMHPSGQNIPHAYRS